MTRGNRGNTTERRGSRTIQRIRLAPETATHIRERINALGLDYNAEAVEEWIARLAQFDGAVWVPIGVETAALAQRLMLRYPDVSTVEALFVYAIQRLAETTDD